MTRSSAEIEREYGPFPSVDNVAGVTFDGHDVWVAAGDKLQAFDPASGEPTRTIPSPADAGTAFDGRHLYQLAQNEIRKIDPATGEILSVIPAPGEGHNSGLAWADGSLWLGKHRARTILQIDPRTGTILRTVESNRFVTGVTWVEGDLWHGTWEGDECSLRRVDPATSEVKEQLDMPSGTVVTGLESDGAHRFFCGGGSSGKVRVVKRPKRLTSPAASAPAPATGGKTLRSPR